MSGTIYVIWEREFINKNEAVYKIGRTDTLSRRINQYPKGSRMIFTILSDDYKKVSLFYFFTFSFPYMGPYNKTI